MWSYQTCRNREELERVLAGLAPAERAAAAVLEDDGRYVVFWEQVEGERRNRRAGEAGQRLSRPVDRRRSPGYTTRS